MVSLADGVPPVGIAPASTRSEYVSKKNKDLMHLSWRVLEESFVHMLAFSRRHNRMYWRHRSSRRASAVELFTVLAFLSQIASRIAFGKSSPLGKLLKTYPTLQPVKDG
jgi:hypothetical protein